MVHDLSDFGLDAELLSDDDLRPSQGALVNRVAALHGRHARDILIVHHEESIANMDAIGEDRLELNGVHDRDTAMRRINDHTQFTGRDDDFESLSLIGLIRVLLFK